MARGSEEVDGALLPLWLKSYLPCPLSSVLRLERDTGQFSSIVTLSKLFLHFPCRRPKSDCVQNYFLPTLTEMKPWWAGYPPGFPSHVQVALWSMMYYCRPILIMSPRDTGSLLMVARKITTELRSKRCAPVVFCGSCSEFSKNLIFHFIERTGRYVRVRMFTGFTWHAYFSVRNRADFEVHSDKLLW